ncbi:uncharacterized protein TM35_000651230 [Trypanosoma theileri]|uniref:Uncharacterized protein n=1 Tax=Trypanosoma theileri TaxID=67003 RepID=A0A1X0NG45_9TRYP|nr:uncharacterized protein TM35_000651230 [Trypanosoma theileri]ORC83561.1 hypothetical protein TM35_000651230 [Trypanosoma theileri]
MGRSVLMGECVLMGRNVLFELAFLFCISHGFPFHTTHGGSGTPYHHYSRICLYHEGVVNPSLCSFCSMAWAIQQHLLFGGTRHHVTRGTGKGHLCGIPFKPILLSAEVGKARVFHHSQPHSFHKLKTPGSHPITPLFFLLRTRRCDKLAARLGLWGCVLSSSPFLG